MNIQKVLTVLGICWILPTLAGQTPSTNRQKTATTVSKTMMPMPLVAPFFIEDEERTGVVIMVNSAPQGLDVDVVLYTLSGEQIATRAVSLAPYSQQTVTIADLLQGSDVQFGSVFIVPHRMTAMAAQLSIAGRNGESTNDIEEEFQMLMGTSPANFKTVTLSKTPVIAVRSLSAEPQTLSIACLAGEAASNGQISIGPIRHCSSMPAPKEAQGLGRPWERTPETCREIKRLWRYRFPRRPPRWTWRSSDSA